jgi:hypothetical protein
MVLFSGEDNLSVRPRAAKRQGDLHCISKEIIELRRQSLDSRKFLAQRLSTWDQTADRHVACQAVIRQ